MKIRTLFLSLLCSTIFIASAQTTMDNSIFGFENFDGPFDLPQNGDGDFFFQTRSHFQGSDAVTVGPSGNTGNKSLKFETTNYNNEVLANNGDPIGNDTALVQTLAASGNTLSDGCYFFTAQIYIPSNYDNGDGGGLRTNQIPLKMSFRQFNAMPFSVNIDLSTVTLRDQWVMVTSSTSTSTIGVDNTRFLIGISELDFPTTDRENGGVFYIDDVNVSLVASVPCDDPSLSNSEFISVKSKSIYPNPAADNVIINSFEKGRIEIINLFGQTVFVTSNTSEETSINISSISSGTYFVKITSKDNGSVVVNKLIIK